MNISHFRSYGYYLANGFISALAFMSVQSFAAAPLTPEIAVVSSAADNLAPGNSSVAVDGQGNFAVAWDSYLQSGGHVYLRFFTATGTPLNNEILVDTNDQEANGRLAYTDPVAVARNSSGQTAVAWSGEHTTANGGDTIYVRTFQSDGSPFSGIVAVSNIVNNAATQVIDEPSIAMVAPDQFVVAWVFDEFLPFVAPNIGTNRSTIYMRRFRIDGTPLGDQTIVASERFAAPGSFYSRLIRVLPNPAGGFALGYHERPKYVGGNPDTSYGNYGMHVRTFDADGKPTSLRLTLATGDDSSALIDLNEFGLSYLANGDLALAYAVPDQLFGSTIDTIYTRRYSPLGVPRAAPVAVATRGKRDYGQRNSLDVAAFASGGYVVTWPDNPQNATFAQYYAADGTANGAPFAVGTGQSIDAATTAGGDVVMSYGAVFARVFVGQ